METKLNTLKQSLGQKEIKMEFLKYLKTHENKDTT